MSAESYNHNGEAALLDQNYSQALEQFNHALNIDNNPKYFANRARALIGLGQLDQANSDIQHALQASNSQSAHAHAAIGELHVKQQDYQAATAAFEKASQLNESNSHENDRNLENSLNRNLEHLLTLLGGSVAQDRSLGDQERGLSSTILSSVLNNGGSTSNKFSLLSKLFLKNSGSSTGGAGSQSMGSLGPLVALVAAGMAGKSSGGGSSGSSSGGLSSLLSSFGGSSSNGSGGYNGGNNGGSSSGFGNISDLINGFTGAMNQGGSSGGQSYGSNSAGGYSQGGNNKYGSGSSSGGSSGGLGSLAGMAQSFLGGQSGRRSDGSSQQAYGNNGYGNDNGNSGGSSFSQYASMAQGFLSNQGNLNQNQGNNNQGYNQNQNQGQGGNNFSQFASMAQGFLNKKN